MAIDMLTPPTEADIEQEAHSQALLAARRKLEAEYQADYQRGQQQHAEVAQRRRAVEQDAVQSLAALRPAYERRAVAEQKRIDLPGFMAAESEIKQGLALIDQALARVWAGIDQNERAHRMIAMRRAAGLPLHHGDVSPGLDKLSKTVIVGILNGFILEGAITVGGRGVGIE